MDSASELMVKGAIPVMMEATKQAAQYRMMAHEQQRNKTMRWVKGVVGAVALYMSGGQNSQLLGEALSPGTPSNTGNAPGGGSGGAAGGIGSILGNIMQSKQNTKAQSKPSNDWQMNTGSGYRAIK